MDVTDGLFSFSHPPPFHFGVSVFSAFLCFRNKQAVGGGAHTSRSQKCSRLPTNVTFRCPPAVVRTQPAGRVLG